MDRGGTAPTGQQGRVDIQTAVFRRIKNRLRQKQTIGHNNGHIGVQRGKFCLFIRTFQRHRVAHGQAQRLGPCVDRCGAVFLASARRARRLAVDGGDVVTGFDQRIQHRNREIRRTHKDNAHVHPTLVLFNRISAPVCATS